MQSSLTRLFSTHLFLWMVATLSCSVLAQTYTVSPQEDLQQVINASSADDTIELLPGIFRGQFEVSHALTLTGQANSVIDANGSGNAILVSADHVTIKNLTIRHWGNDLTNTDAGIKVRHANQIDIQGNTLSGDGFGIYLENVTQAQIRDNNVSGNDKMRSTDRGNGIHLISVQQAEVSNNQVNNTRDGLYIINSQNNELRGNTLTDLRFGIHYMYSYSNTVSDNVSQRVDVGYALMSSQNLIIRNNTALDCRDYGLLMNFVNTSDISENRVARISAGANMISGDEGKALFIYNSTGNQIHNNTFSDSDMGIHLTAGSVGNEIYGNQFINNQIQVKYVSSELQEWSKDGRGNFWSNYIGWDLNQDGVGDYPFEPNDDVDKLIWKYPEAKVLMDSPAVLLLRWVQRSFPVLKSPGVKDSFPLYHKQVQ